jgi:ABC-2 type transport system ATP-binding protein
VLFSSHQLDVVERLCDDLVIIAAGEIRAAGSRKELRAQHSRRRFELISATSADWLRGEPGIQLVSLEGGYAVFDADSEQTAQRVLRQAVAHGDVASFAPRHPTLAEIFKEVIQ